MAAAQSYTKHAAAAKVGRNCCGWRRFDPSAFLLVLLAPQLHPDQGNCARSLEHYRRILEHYHPQRPTRSATKYLRSLRPLGGSVGRPGPTWCHRSWSEGLARGADGSDELQTEARQVGSPPPSVAHTFGYHVSRKPPAARWVRGSPWADVVPP